MVWGRYACVCQKGHVFGRMRGPRWWLDLWDRFTDKFLWPYHDENCRED